MEGIPRYPQLAPESYRLEESLCKTKILAAEEYPGIGRRSATEPPSAIKLHAVKSPALLALRSRCDCSPTLLPGHVGADVGLRRLL